MDEQDPREMDFERLGEGDVAEAYLQVLAGDGLPPVVRIDQDPFRIGRQTDNHLRLGDNRISRHHARIRRQGNRFLIEDARSLNGTYVDGVPVEGSHLLAPGEILQIGSYLFGFRLGTPESEEVVEGGTMIVSASAVAALDDVEALLQETRLSAAYALAAALDVRDPYTGSHADTVSRYSVAIAREMGLSRDRVAVIGLGALLHDIGKIGIPDHILRKEGPLTDEEWRTMRDHPALGKAILARMSGMEEILPVAFSHQERLDGRGYPSGIKGSEIPIGARITAAADAYHAMVSHRPYSQGRGKQATMEELQRCVGTHFDPEVIAAFIRVLSR